MPSHFLPLIQRFILCCFQGSISRMIARWVFVYIAKQPGTLLIITKALVKHWIHLHQRHCFISRKIMWHSLIFPFYHEITIKVCFFTGYSLNFPLGKKSWEKCAFSLYYRGRGQWVLVITVKGSWNLIGRKSFR